MRDDAAERNEPFFMDKKLLGAALKLSIIIILLIQFAPRSAVADALKGWRTGLSCEEVKASLAQGDISLNLFSDLVDTCQLKSVEEVLQKIPPENLSKYSLLAESRSLQAASPEFPRAVVSANNGHFIFTFNGDANQAGYNSIEMMGFREDTNVFELQRINFLNPQTPGQITEINPALCLKCHTQNPHPIWDGAPFWPGAYGPIWEYPNAGELNRTAKRFFYDHFWPNGKIGRYGFLSENIYFPESPSTQNALIGTDMGKLNNAKIAQEIKSNSDLYPYRYAILAGTMIDGYDGHRYCGKSEDYIPEKIRKRFQKSFEVIRAEVHQVQRNYIQERIDRLKLLSGNGPNPCCRLEYIMDNEDQDMDVKSMAGAANIKYILQLVRPSLKWSMDFHSAALDFSYGIDDGAGQEPADSIQDLEVKLHQIVFDNKLPDSCSNRDTQECCKELQSLSLKALADVP